MAMAFSKIDGAGLQKLDYLTRDAEQSRCHR